MIPQPSGSTTIEDILRGNRSEWMLLGMSMIDTTGEGNKHPGWKQSLGRINECFLPIPCPDILSNLLSL